jgi:tRNA (mo5U34)-methyltransferase
MTTDAQQLKREVARHRWYHTLELGDGVVTDGMFDHRAVRDGCLLPLDLTGMRCLDVGTMDGFWAFEMERRGAAEVIAADVATIDELDVPPRWRKHNEADLEMGGTTEERFRLAKAALGSSVSRVERSVYQLTGNELGSFDLIFCGDLLVHLKDPVTAIQRLRGVCRGSAIVVEPVKRSPPFRRRPLAEFDGIDGFRWWLLSEATIERMMLAAGFQRVEIGRRFELPAKAPGRWRGLRAVMRGFA